MTKALLIIDMQNDFMDTGALAIMGARTIIPLISSLMEFFPTIIASKDWHPADHHSFAANHPDKNVGDIVKLHGIEHTLWPVHCVAHTYGSHMVEGLNTERFDHIVLKGSDPTIDSYSAFFDNAHKRSTGLQQELKRRNVDELYLCGVATDYCVKYTAFDAHELGYSVYVIEDACKSVELKVGDTAQAFCEMRAAGAHIISSKDNIK